MENTLNIQLKVTDEQMTSLLKGKIESLPDEKVQEIFANALTEFLKSNQGTELFYNKGSHWNSTPTPTPLLEKMIANAISKDLLTECVTEFVATLKENYENLIKSAMVKTFSDMFFTEMRSVKLYTEMTNLIYNQEK